MDNRSNPFLNLEDELVKRLMPRLNRKSKTTLRLVCLKTKSWVDSLPIFKYTLTKIEISSEKHLDDLLQLRFKPYGSFHLTDEEFPSYKNISKFLERFWRQVDFIKIQNHPKYNKHLENCVCLNSIGITSKTWNMDDFEWLSENSYRHLVEVSSLKLVCEEYPKDWGIFDSFLQKFHYLRGLSISVPTHNSPMFLNEYLQNFTMIYDIIVNKREKSTASPVCKEAYLSRIFKNLTEIEIDFPYVKFFRHFFARDRDFLVKVTLFASTKGNCGRFTLVMDYECVRRPKIKDAVQYFLSVYFAPEPKHPLEFFRFVTHISFSNLTPSDLTRFESLAFYFGAARNICKSLKLHFNPQVKNMEIEERRRNEEIIFKFLRKLNNLESLSVTSWFSPVWIGALGNVRKLELFEMEYQESDFVGNPEKDDSSLRGHLKVRYLSYLRIENRYDISESVYSNVINRLHLKQFCFVGPKEPEQWCILKWCSLLVRYVKVAYRSLSV